MRMLLLLTPGREAPVSLPKLAQMGYDVSLVDTRVSMDLLTDTWRNRPAFTLRAMRPAYNRLRAAWVSMLRRFVDADYYTIFGEADCFPLISSQRMCQWIDAIPTDADVVKLCSISHRGIWRKLTEENPDFDSSPINFNRIEHYVHHRGVIGTHAMWVRPSAREKLADLYANAHMPVDNVLAPADAHGILKIYRTSSNITVQAPYKIQSVELNIKPILDGPPDLLVVVVVHNGDTQINSKILKIKEIIPEGSKLVVSVPAHCSYTDEAVYIRQDSCSYLADYLPALTVDDIASYPMTAFLSLDNVYPENYLSELALRYQCLDFSYPQYGFGGHLFPVYKGTLAIATEVLATTEVADISRANSRFMHYDLTTWNATDKIEHTPNVQLSKDLFASDLMLGDEPYRMYNDDVLSLTTGIHGVVTAREQDTINILWDGEEQEVVYKKSSSCIFEKL